LLEFILGLPPVRASHSHRSTSFTEIQITVGHSRPRPKHLAKKLLQIRLSLGVSQGEMVKRLGVQDLIHYTTISKYELDKNEPPLAILLAYARLVGIPIEQIIDDELELTI
jgi:DNA-binding XRE family transcriptional regulator